MMQAFQQFMQQFQPSLPARGATPEAEHLPQQEEISTLAPREGSDLGSLYPNDALRRISTLAPREGSDGAVL